MVEPPVSGPQGYVPPAPAGPPPGYEPPSAPKRGRPSWLAAVLIPLITLVVVGAALGGFLAARGGGTTTSTGAETTAGPETTLASLSSTTQSAAAPTTTTATTEAPATTTTAGSITVTTAGGPGSLWQQSPTSLQDLAALVRQAIAPGQTVYLPGHLPSGWGMAAPGQAYGDIAAGYFQDLAGNPSVNMLDGDADVFRQYTVCFTNGTEVVGVLVIIGDWGDTPFEEVTAYGKKMWVYQDSGLVAVLVPGWDQGTVVGTPGSREAALEIAASIRAW